MNTYSIYCTEEQTRKAIELGAPIAQTDNRFDGENFSPIYKDGDKWVYADIPTAEQMIGWLEEKICFSDITIEKYEHHWRWFIFGKCHLYSEDKKYNSRKEATLSAIDAALEYLTNNNK